MSVCFHERTLWTFVVVIGLLCFNVSFSVVWDQIVSEHGAMLYRVAYCILRDEGDAEDVVQDVLLEAYRNHHDNGNIPPGGLLRRMATLRAIDRLRRRKRFERIDDIPTMTSDSFLRE